MKKLFVALLAVVLVGGVANVNAMSEKDLLAKISQTYTVNGKTVKVDQSILVQVERYLDTYEVSEADADIIAAQIDEVAAYMKKNNITSYDQLSKEGKNVVANAVKTISNKTSVKLSISDSGALTVYAPGTNKVFAVVDSDGVVIRKTGNTYAIVAVAGVITLAGAVIAFRKFAKTNA